MNIVKKVIFSIFMVVFALVWSVQAAGLVGAAVSSLNSINATSRIIVVLSIILSLLGLIFVWMGKFSLHSKESAHFTYILCNVYFGSLILLVILYMAFIGDIKYVLLAECVVTWVIWFVLMNCIKKIESSFYESVSSSEGSQNEEVVQEVSSKETKSDDEETV